MNKKLKKGLVVSAAAMGMGIALPTVSVMAAPVTANGWVMEGTNWYYYVNGVKLVNAWVQDSKGWCYLGADGAAIKEGWAKDSIGWCYITNYNWDKTSTWRQDSAGWQFIGANGYWDASVPARATNPLDVFAIGSISVVDATHIKVVFTQAVDADTAEDAGNYDFDTLDIEDVELQSDGKTVIITLDETNAAGVLTNDDEDDYTVEITDIDSKAGKTIPDYKQVLNLYDDVRPTVKSIEMTDEDTLEIKFSEAIKGAEADGVIEILDENGDAIDGLDVEIDGDDSSIVTVSGLANDEEDSVDRTLVINGGLKDFADNRISPTPYEEDFTIEEDTTDPEVKSISAVSLDTFKVTFSESLGEVADAVDLNDLFDVTVADVLLTEGEGADYTVTKDGNVYTIQLAAPYAEGTLVKIKISDFKDKAGNAGDAYAKYLKFKEVGPELESTEANIKTIEGNKYAILTYDQDIEAFNFEALDATYVDEDDADVEATISEYALFDYYDAETIDGDDVDFSDYLDKDQVAIALSAIEYDYEGDAALETVAALETGDYTVTLPEGFATAFGSDSNEVDVTFSVTKATSEVETLGAVVDGDKVTVTFSGEVGNSALDLDNYEVEGSNVFGSAVFTNADKDTVKLTIKAGAIKYDGEYELAVSNIVDADGNEVDDETFMEDFTETVKPYITKAVVTDLNEIVVTFNEGIYGTITPADFDVTVDGTEVDIDAATLYSDQAKKNWVLTIKAYDAIDDVDATVKVGVSEDFDGEDKNGNEAVTPGVMKTATWDLDATPIVPGDFTAPVIAAVADANVETDVVDWAAPATTATDAVDGDITDDIVVTYSSTDDGADVDDLASAQAWLATEGNKVTVTYTVEDAAGNVDTETAVFTAVVPAP